MTRTNPEPTSPLAQPAGPASTTRDDIAYVAPFAAFMLLTTLGGQPGWYPLCYILKTLIVAVMLWYYWPLYTRISWKYWPLGAAVGALGLVQWVGTEKLILSVWPDYPRLTVGEPFNPFAEFATPAAAWAFIAIRWAGATLLVPVMEELFWRDYLHRQIAAPSDFKMVPIGEPDWKAFLAVAVIFGAGVHIQWFTAVLYGLMIGGLLLYTRSLGACIVCHAVTNFLLGAYVLLAQDWYFW